MKRYSWIVLVVLFAVFISVGTGMGAVSDPPDIRISKLDFEDAEIRQVLKTLSQIGGRNIVVDQNITETCTIYLSDVTWKEALLAVLKMNDLVGYQDGSFIKVIKLEDYEEQIESYRERERLDRLHKPASVQVIKIHNARAEDIKSTLDPLLAEEDQPSVDLRTNSLVFTVSDSSLAVISQIVSELDTETRQVAIEVKMVTVDSNSLTELGVNWSATSSTQTDRTIAQESLIAEDKLLVGSWSGSAGATDIMATVATLIDEQNAEVVSRPHVITQDNETALISSGQEVPVTTYDEARNTVIELIQASTELEVTPHILSDNRILLDIHASRRSAEGVGTGLKINEEDAQVRMITSDGETAVIGGLRQVQDSKQESGIPILQDIPLLGQAFKYTKRETKKTDLVIFITPRIVDRTTTTLSQE